MGLGLEQKRMAAVRRPRGGFQNGEDRLAPHSGNHDRVHFTGPDPRQAAAQAVLDPVRPIKTPSVSGPFQRAGTQVAGDCFTDLPVEPQPVGEIRVICADIGKPGTLRHPSGNQMQPRRQFQRPHGLSPFQ